MLPLVSIIIPVYNGSNFLDQAIDSALNQSYSNIEIIIVNDGSNDNNRTKKIALGYGDKIRYLQKKNGGVASALNLGIQNMNGEYFSWLSHDDIYYPNKIEKQLEAMSNTNNKILVWSNFDMINDLSKITTKYNPSNFKKFKNDLEYIIYTKIHGCSLLIPKSAFDEVGYFDEDLKTVQDNHMWFRMVQNGYKLKHINQSLIQSRQHHEQGTVIMGEIHSQEISIFFNWVYSKIKDVIKYDKVIKDYIQSRI